VVSIWSAVSMLSCNGDTVQWPARPTSPQLMIQGVRDCHRVGIELDHAEQTRTVAVERLDTRDVHLGQIPDRQRPGPKIRA
jgi:hypothetical protein